MAAAIPAAIALIRGSIGMELVVEVVVEVVVEGAAVMGEPASPQCIGATLA
jgi:hypothetical protein